VAAALLAAPPSDAADPVRATSALAWHTATAPGQDDAESCLRCHEDVRAQVEQDYEHMPAAAGMCAACHSPHAARYEHLLNERERALCYACHSDSIDSFQTGNVHTPVKQGQCGVCHQVHGSEHEKLLSSEGNDLCLGCHTQHATMQGLQTTHMPFVDGDCTSCHAPHNSPNPDQLAAPTESLCRLCHQPASADLLESHQGIPVDGTRCTSCHDAHASAGSELFLPVAHQPFADGSCDMCHLVDSETPALPRATGARLCGACHGEVPNPRDAVVHQPVADGNCEACHVPHASKEAGLLVAAQRETCTRCHAEIEERARSSRSVHPFKASDGGCLGCHSAHSADSQWLLAGGEIRRCLTCHESMRHGHPLGEDRIDPRTGQAITCVTCHDPHGTDFPMHLRGDQTRGLCLECHQTDH
jgi:predicted CXXCH cytochrome family protein